MRKGKLPPGVYRVRKKLANGSVATYYYDRKTKTRLEGEPGTPKFRHSLQAARNAPRSTAGASAKTVADLINEYEASAHFRTKLSEETRRSYRLGLSKILSEYGDVALEDLEDKAIRGDVFQWRDGMAKKGPRAADFATQMFCTIVSFAYDRGLVSINHLLRMGKLAHSDRSDIIWEPEHIEAFCRVAPLVLRRAVILALYTGQRRGDLLRLTRANYDGQYIHLVQQKTGMEVHVPVHRDLKPVLDAPADNPLGLYLPSPMGLPYLNFARDFKAAKRRAGPEVDRLHFHDLRGTAVTRLSEAGAEVTEIATFTGHSLQSVAVILERYLSRTKRLSTRALEKLEGSETHSYANWLLTDPQTIEK